MSKKTISTEEKIKAAAIEVFTQKGYEATTTRDITDVAGLKNLASLHYYFKSKDQLFDVVIEHTMGNFSQLMDQILNNPTLELHQKIRKFVPAYIDFIMANPFLPMFILSEGEKNPQKMDYLMNDKQMLPSLSHQIQALVDDKIIRPTTIEHFISDLIGLTIFPFLSKSLMKLKTGLNEAGFLKMVEERKLHVPEMIIRSLYLKEPKG
ncbi:MAG: TetR/AcrR family transcriptional regulator [Bacteroidota bacterium]